MFLGACAAARDGSLAAVWLGLTVIGIFAIEVAKNASGEIFDFDSGADLGVSPEDRSPFSGGKRVLVDGLLTRGQTAAIAAVGYAVGAAAGLAIVFGREPGVLVLGVIGLACAFFYHAPPVKLSYRGLGEVAVGLCYGPLIACGTYLVQRGRVSSEILFASVPLGLLIAAFLWINEFPDYSADLRADKRTLVVRLGRPRSAVVFAGLVGAALTIQALLPLVKSETLPVIPRGVWLGLLGLVPAFSSARRLLSTPAEVAKIVPAQRDALLAFLLLAAGSGIGLLLT
jgi:1,4-dihydroxy-2-naphthoate octaprenyltransferase